MPIYEYKAKSGGCDRCRRPFSKLQKMSDKPLAACPECGAAVDRVISKFAVSKDRLSTSRLKEHGFKKFVRKDKGVYEDETA